MRSLAVLAAALALALPAAAGAESLRVTSTAEAGRGSLGRTILDAGAGDTIRLPAGSFPLTHGNALVEQRNTLVGAGTSRTTIVPTGGGEALAQGGVRVSRASIEQPLNPPPDSNPVLETKVQVVALIATLALVLLVLDLVRRRRLAERYALLWMSASAGLLVLAIWRGGLEVIADLMGIEQPANALFILAFGVGFVLLLHFSVATSRLSEETKILAQESARLEQELRAARAELPGANGSSAATEQGAHERPVAGERGA